MITEDERKVDYIMQVIYHTSVSENEEVDKEYPLPKNIRQVGNPGIKRKIYMEDYVVTYLSKLALPSNVDARGAILLGNVRKSKDEITVFISGALEAQNFELDLNETMFTNENWANIYNEIREYFPDLFIVGWFVSRLGFSTELNGKIIQTHNNYFAGDNKVLYMIDALENEDDFYLYENGGLKRQKGYYIYYEKNDAMQSYMIKKQKNNKKLRENEILLKRDQKIVESYRKVVENRKKNISRKKGDKQESKFYYVASTFLVMAILAVSVTIFNRYDKMVLLEATLGRTTEIVEVEENTEEKIKESTEKSEKSTEHIGESTLVEKSDESQEEMVATYYVVKEGDTLNAISKKMFQSTNYVEDILSINHMSKETPIYPGQKIKIPMVDK